MKLFSKLLFLFIFINPLLSVGQSEELPATKHQLGIKLGTAQPMGEYASQDFNSQESAYAKQGMALGVFYHYYFDEYVAVSAEYSHYRNAFDEEALSDDFRASSNNSWSVTADPYRITFIGTGLKFCFGNEKVKGYINPMVGSANYTNPYYEISLYGGQTSKAEEVSTAKIAMKLNFGADVSISRTVSFGFNFEYFNPGTFEFETEENYYFNGALTRSTEIDGDVHRSLFNASFNLGFNF